ncbi:type II toxin-antitoxin system VapB family antitoxin [Shinella sp. HZN7]|uniref:type II toxin-antitoxin system VapB family antitoxin n=1 Tax=Shinella sp. (strain HZN7) TaxID=879274 RepID=UPI0007DA75AE|nr:type II toxin-antitoxin system VapB family antitoxin [Shinella sp. HZN7]ANH03575.1 transcriptional regulator [Shinella sp. HZN7]
MRTNIDLDDDLIAKAKEFTGLSTKKAIVDLALRELVQNWERREALENLRGMGWEGDLDEMRTDIDPDEELLPDAAE